jgi:putative transposase
MDDIHFNPVKHGLVGHPADWRLSSFGRYDAMGLYSAAWAIDGVRLAATGERL